MFLAVLLCLGFGEAPAIDSTTDVDSAIVLPAPTGPYAVGGFMTHAVDAARPDSTGASRPLDLQFWYPARASSAEPAAYATPARGVGEELAHLFGRVRVHARRRAPFAAAAGRAPVVVLSTGRSMGTYDYTSLAEDLASRGYVVVGVASPGLSRMSTLEGSPVAVAPAPTLAMLQHFDDADSFLEPMVRDVTADLRFVVRSLDGIARSDSTLAHRLDLGRIAMVGHSNGALAAARACAAEPRCRACLGIEGTQARDVRKGGVRKPYGLIISEQSLGYDVENVYRELGTRSPGSYTVIRLRGAGHNSSADVMLVRPALFKYTMPALEGIAVSRLAVRAFLDDHLRGRGDASLRAALAGHPEIELQTTFSR